MEQIVSKRLRSFIDSHLSRECGEVEIDDVLVSYIAGILDGVSQAESGDDFDVDEFADVMSAYVPGFEAINRPLVYEWINNTASCVKDPTSVAVVDVVSEPACVATANATSVGASVTDEEQPSLDALSLKEEEKAPASSRKRGKQGLKGKRPRGPPTESSRTDSLSCSRNSNAAVDEVTADENVSMLQDMFPDVAVEAIHAALLQADGVLEQSISLLLEQQSADICLGGFGEGVTMAKSPTESKSLYSKPRAAPRQPCSSRENHSDDDQIKDFVIGRYLLVDEAEDERQHRPHLQTVPKTKQKTMYRDSHVVSTKGERYSLVTKKDQEDDGMKKTYVSLKPLRKYRFH